MKTKFTMIMAVIATFAISLNLHSSNEEVVFGAPAVQMPRGGPKYCAFEAEWENCKMAATGTVCISEDGKCGTGVEVGAPGEGILSRFLRIGTWICLSNRSVRLKGKPAVFLLQFYFVLFASFVFWGGLARYEDKYRKE